jgi:hypothetical protein
MWNWYIYLILSLIFAGSGVLIGWGLTTSKQFKHTDKKTQKEQITWWLVCIVAAAAALILTMIIALVYHSYNKQAAWNTWDPYSDPRASQYGAFNPWRGKKKGKTPKGGLQKPVYAHKKSGKTSSTYGAGCGCNKGMW